MEESRWYSTGEVARLLGLSRDALISALRYGAPEPTVPRAGGRRVFTAADVARLREWLAARGRRVGA